MINKTNNYPVITQYTVTMASSASKKDINNTIIQGKTEGIRSLIRWLQNMVKWGSGVEVFL